jgi:hypothetical protein
MRKQFNKGDTMTRTYAALLIPENFPAISADCAKWNLNVDYDQLDADYEEAERYDIDHIYAVLSFDDERPQAGGCYTAQWSLGFDETWLFTGQTYGTIWKRIELIQS